jgi:undecaprenyl-diphosphatase
MNTLHAILLGIVQGIAEWFPISSSGHLVFFQQILRIKADILFDLCLHIGSVLALILFFWKDILSITKNIKYIFLIIVACIPTAIIGFVFHDLLSSFFENLLIVGLGFIVTGIILYLTKFAKGKNDINFFSSFFIGIAQGIAIIPGISRSGATISAGIFSGVKREQAARFSFILALPAIVGATVFEFARSDVTSFELQPALWGMLASMIVGYFSLGLLMKLIKKGKFHVFSSYCILLGIITLILNFIV